MRAVDIFVHRNRIGNFADREMSGQRLLQHDAMRQWIGAQLVEPGTNLPERRALGEALSDDLDADPLPGSRQIADVGTTRFVLAHKDDCQFGMNPLPAQRTRTSDEFRTQIGGKASSVENRGGHAVAVSSVEGGAPTLKSSPMYRYVVWLIALLGLALAFGVLEPFFASHSSKTAGPAGLTGQSAPVFGLSDDRGSPVSLDRYRGHIVVMNLWASWCPPCRAEMPDLQHLANLYSDRGIAIVGVNEGESAERARAFAESLQIRFPIWIDGSERYGRTYGALGLPTTVILDRRGTVVRGFDGALTFDQMRAAVAPLATTQ
jgi:cytochrome c biogenesis protein CcmG, thiol:disulfide interchange protein DsbE